MSETLWVPPDAPSRTTAKGHGWAFSYRAGWVCPKCVAKGE